MSEKERGLSHKLMENKGVHRLKWQLEGVWWLFTALVVISVMFPVWRYAQGFPYMGQNVLFIVLFVTLIRHLFLLKYTFLAKAEKWKIALIFVSMLLWAYTFRAWADVRSYLRADGFEPHFAHLDMEQMFAMAHYTRNEILFFLTGTLIALTIFPFRMVLSIWRVRNRGTV